MISKISDVAAGFGWRGGGAGGAAAGLGVGGAGAAGAALGGEGIGAATGAALGGDGIAVLDAGAGATGGADAAESAFFTLPIRSWDSKGFAIWSAMPESFPLPAS